MEISVRKINDKFIAISVEKVDEDILNNPEAKQTATDLLDVVEDLLWYCGAEGFSEKCGELRNLIIHA